MKTGFFDLEDDRCRLKCTKNRTQMITEFSYHLSPQSNIYIDDNCFDRRNSKMQHFYVVNSNHLIPTTNDLRLFDNYYIAGEKIFNVESIDYKDYMNTLKITFLI